MGVINSRLGFAGTLKTRVIHAPKAPFSWRIKNTLRLSFLRGWFAFHVARPIAAACGVATLMGSLSIKVRKAGGEIIDYGLVSYRVITTAGVTFLRDDWNANAQDYTTFNFHGCGTGTNAEAVGDTALQTESTTALNPDSVRATGTRSVPSATSWLSVGTATFDATTAVTEHGILSASATGSGTLWDRSVFTAINVVSGDSIQFSYTCSLTAGG